MDEGGNGIITTFSDQAPIIEICRSQMDYDFVCLPIKVTFFS